jgi:signal transduction histidine kinase/CheY-like chemotaxis protein
VLVPDALTDAALAAFRPVIAAEGIRALAFIPLVHQECLLGKFMLYYDAPHEFSDEELDAAGTVATQVAFALDRARAQAAIEAHLTAEQAARAEAEAASRAKDEFIAMVSHELRTPLTAMLGWTRMLRSRQLDTRSSTHALEVIERNLRQQTQILTDLLDVSRIVSGKLTLDVQMIDLAPIIEMALEVVRPAADAKRLVLTTALDQCGGTVCGDATRLQQVFWNLISNAVKFTPTGGRVEVALEQAGDYARISVKDTGRGISKEFLPHLFERFRQAETGTTRQHGGLGLGLAIVRHLVELHGGRVEAFSAGEGEGASFVVELPLAHASPLTAPSLDLPSPHRHGKPTLENVRVLIVDDHQDTVEFLAAALAKYGAHVGVARSVPAALGVLGETLPHVLVSDISMPGEDGFDLMRRVRERTTAGDRLTAIALTAHARAEDRDRALAAGFQMYLAKPIEPARLGYIIEALVKGRRETPD